MFICCCWLIIGLGKEPPRYLWCFVRLRAVPRGGLEVGVGVGVLEATIYPALSTLRASLAGVEACSVDVIAIASDEVR